MASLVDAVLGDHALALSQRDGVPAYEETHAEVQNVLLPPGVPRGLSFQVLQSVNKHVALTHRLLLESGKPSSNNPFAALMGGGPQVEKDEFGRPKHYRHCAVGGVVSHVTPGGAKLRLSGSVDTDFKTTVTSMVDATGTGKFTLVGQAIRKRFDGGLLPASWGATGTVRGGDYTACVRAKDGPELGASYNQRLAPGSRLTLGGEVLLSVPTLAAMLAPAPAVGGRGLAPPSAGKPVEWSVGAAYDGDLTKSALHVDFTGQRSRTVSAHHVYKVTDRAWLAAKGILDTGSLNSMVSVGYRLRFRNAASLLYGQVDSYGNLRTVIEREPVKDVKVAFGSEVKLLGPADNVFGLRVTIGSQPALPRTLSPILMSRDVFGTP